MDFPRGPVDKNPRANIGDRVLPLVWENATVDKNPHANIGDRVLPSVWEDSTVNKNPRATTGDRVLPSVWEDATHGGAAKPKRFTEPPPGPESHRH